MYQVCFVCTRDYVADTWVYHTVLPPMRCFCIDTMVLVFRLNQTCSISLVHFDYAYEMLLVKIVYLRFDIIETSFLPQKE